MSARSFVAALSLLLLAACKDEPSDTVDSGVVANPHCKRPSSVACDQPEHRQEACVCDKDSQCESGYCGLETKYCMHVCLWKPFPVALGARCDCDNACDAGGCLEACPADTYCKDLGLESRCTTLEGVGAPCPSYPNVCKSGLACVKGACQAPKYVGEGEACGDDFVQCNAGLYCNGGKCLKPKPAGSSCSGPWECEGPFASCEPCSAGSTSYCCSESLVGKSCTGTCPVQGLYCSSIDSKCREVHEVGGACDPADSADQCPRDPLTRFSSKCDPATKTCVGGYCL